jgi:hypothetical protein
MRKVDQKVEIRREIVERVIARCGRLVFAGVSASSG